MVDNGKVVCPISATVFLELMKQNDIETRMATAKIIDHLSFGVTLIASHERVKQELCNATYSILGAKDSIPIDQLVWTKLSYIFGDYHPYDTSFDAAEELIIQKSFFDHMWDISLVEMMNHINYESWEQFDWQKTAEMLNLANKEHTNELRSYQHAYRIEFDGVLSLFNEQLIQIFKEAYKAGYNNDEINNKKKSKNEKLKQFAQLVRTLHIGASCHAAVRWDQKRQLNGNDLLDFHHAEAALGYCDLFLTEKPLKVQVSQEHLGLRELFSCSVESSASEGLKILNMCKI